MTTAKIIKTCGKGGCPAALTWRKHPGTGAFQHAVFCGCGRASSWQRSEQEAVTAWNGRPSIAALNDAT